MQKVTLISKYIYLDTLQALPWVTLCLVTTMHGINLHSAPQQMLRSKWKTIALSLADWYLDLKIRTLAPRWRHMMESAEILQHCL
jgi:hypothetical protein